MNCHVWKDFDGFLNGHTSHRYHRRRRNKLKLAMHHVPCHDLKNFDVFVKGNHTTHSIHRRRRSKLKSEIHHVAIFKSSSKYTPQNLIMSWRKI